jgi:hypothetical protein
MNASFPSTLKSIAVFRDFLANSAEEQQIRQAFFAERKRRERKYLTKTGVMHNA